MFKGTQGIQSFFFSEIFATGFVCKINGIGWGKKSIKQKKMSKEGAEPKIGSVFSSSSRRYGGKVEKRVGGAKMR